MIAAYLGTMNFAIKLKKLMGEHRYSQPALAKILDVSQGTVSNWTLGRNMPDSRQCLTLARLFGVSMEFLTDDALDEPASDGLTREEQQLLHMAELFGSSTVLRWIKAGATQATLEVAGRGHRPAQTHAYGGSDVAVDEVGELDDDQGDMPSQPVKAKEPPRVIAAQDMTESYRRELAEKNRPKKVERKPKGKPKGEK